MCAWDVAALPPRARWRAKKAFRDRAPREQELSTMDLEHGASELSLSLSRVLSLARELIIVEGSDASV